MAYRAMYSPAYPAMGACPREERAVFLSALLSAPWAENVVGFEPHYGGFFCKVELCNGYVLEGHLTSLNAVAWEWVD